MGIKIQILADIFAETCDSERRNSYQFREERKNICMSKA